MIVREYKNGLVTVRIHDEYCNEAAAQSLSQLDRIVSNSYRRRKLEQQPEVAAFRGMDQNARTML